jgi:signal transduction histidine kinase
MPPSNTWMTITIRTPYILVLLVIIIFLWLITLAVIKSRQKSRQIQSLNNRIEVLNTQLDGSDISSLRDAYLQFIYNISHEVANPLQSVQTNLEIMVDSPGEIGQWKQYYAIIKQEIKRLITLTENLRLLSQLERTTGPIVREPINLQTVIEDVIMMQTDRASARNISIQYEGPNRPAKVFGNRVHLHQVIINLVDNSIKYSKKSGGEIVIHLSEEANYVHILVQDDGTGIPEEDLPHVFDTAYRSRSVQSDRQSGSGLGLAIVKRIVEQHEGRVRAVSIVGEGTTVTVDLPLYNPG